MFFFAKTKKKSESCKLRKGKFKTLSLPDDPYRGKSRRGDRGEARRRQEEGGNEAEKRMKSNGVSWRREGKKRRTNPRTEISCYRKQSQTCYLLPPSFSSFFLPFQISTFPFCLVFFFPFSSNPSLICFCRKPSKKKSKHIGSSSASKIDPTTRTRIQMGLLGQYES